ncbi:hypothetical protein HOC01_03205 [archaeon]|jgi:hypothetical protein|nr:hypothetical protein [archaeon]MBT6698103.1 hypothetical protein [archaeon]
MITKQYFALQEASTSNQSLPLVIIINDQEELGQSLQILSQRTGLRGLSFQSSLLQELNKPSTLKQSKANYFEIILEDQKHIQAIKEHCHSKNAFIQITIILSKFSVSLLKELRPICKRLIIDFQNSNSITKPELNHLFAELITHNFYPFTINANPKLVEPKFRVEYFQNSQDSKKLEDKDALAFLMEKQAGDLL